MFNLYCTTCRLLFQCYLNVVELYNSKVLEFCMNETPPARWTAKYCLRFVALTDWFFSSGHTVFESSLNVGRVVSFHSRRRFYVVPQMKGNAWSPEISVAKFRNSFCRSGICSFDYILLPTSYDWAVRIHKEWKRNFGYAVELLMLDEYRELPLHRTITQQPNKLAETVTHVTCFLDVPRSNLDRRRHSYDCMCGFPQSIQRRPE
jgi:hypothetical protein